MAKFHRISFEDFSDLELKSKDNEEWSLFKASLDKNDFLEDGRIIISTSRWNGQILVVKRHLGPSFSVGVGTPLDTREEFLAAANEYLDKYRKHLTNAVYSASGYRGWRPHVLEGDVYKQKPCFDGPLVVQV